MRMTLRYVESPADGSPDFAGQAMGDAAHVPTQFTVGLFAAKAGRQDKERILTVIDLILII
jgi:hypothetical protein